MKIYRLGGIGMDKSILVIVEHDGCRLKISSKEILSFSSEIALRTGMKVFAAVYGSAINHEMFEEIGKCGVGEIYYGENHLFLMPNVDILLPFLAEVITECRPQFVFTGNTPIGKDLLPPLAQIFSSEMVSDVIQINTTHDSLQFIKTIFGGKIIEINEHKKQRVFATIRPNAIGIRNNMAVIPSIKVIKSQVDPPINYILKEVVKKNQSRKPLYEAEIIVCGGRGIKRPEDFSLLEELAGVLGASLGYTRAVIDAGFKPRSLQIGQTGKTVSPKIVITCGISGAIQFVAGISTAQHIIAINKDQRATIFKTAHYGIIGDLYQVVPALTDEFKRILNK